MTFQTMTAAAAKKTFEKALASGRILVHHPVRKVYDAIFPDAMEVFAGQGWKKVSTKDATEPVEAKKADPPAREAAEEQQEGNGPKKPPRRTKK